MSLKQHFPGKFEYSYQDPATLNQAAAVVDTWYDILPETQNVWLHTIGVATVDQNETLEVQIIVDGVTIGANDQACTDGQNNTCYLALNAVGRIIQCYIQTNVQSNSLGVLESIRGHKVQVQVRKTTAAGVSQLRGIVGYSVLEEAG